MEQKIYAVYDMKIKIWEEGKIGFRNHMDAIRAFELAVNQTGTKFNAHPEDYAFYEIGTWNDETGLYTNLETKTCLGIASDFKKTVAPPLQNISQ